LQVDDESTAKADSLTSGYEAHPCIVGAPGGIGGSVRAGAISGHVRVIDGDTIVLTDTNTHVRLKPAKRKAARGRPWLDLKSPSPYARADTLLREERLKAT
jgi:hypothetical protein